jgi:WD40 repeat protein
MKFIMKLDHTLPQVASKLGGNCAGGRIQKLKIRPSTHYPWFLLLGVLLVCIAPQIAFGQPAPKVTVLSLGTAIVDLDYSPNGRWLAVVSRTVIVLYDAKTLQQKHVLLKDGNQPVSSEGQFPADIAFSPDSKLLAHSTGAGKVILWDVETGTECGAATQEIERFQHWGEVIFSPDGNLLVLIGREILLWNLRREAVQTTISIPSELGVESLTFRPDGKVLAGVVISDAPLFDPITFWDARTGALLGTAQEKVNSITYSPDGRFLAVSGREGIELSKVENDEVIHTWKGGGKILFSPDSKFLAGSTLEGLRVWNVDTGAVHQTFKPEDVTTYAFSLDSQTLATGTTSGVKFWDIETGTLKATISGGAERVATFSSDKTLITARLKPERDFNTISLLHWDIDKAIPLKEIDIVSGRAIFEAIKLLSADGQWFAVRKREEITVWNARTGDLLQTWQRPQIGLRNVAFSPNNRFLAAVWTDGIVTLWGLDSGVEHHRFSLTLPSQLAFSPDGRTLAINVNEGKIQLWEIQSEKRMGELFGKQSRIDSLAFSPDGKLLASGGSFEIRPFHSQQTIQLWEISTGKPLDMIEGSDLIKKLVFSPDGRILAAADGVQNNSITLWSVADGRELLTIGGLDVDEGALAFSPDGRRLVTVSGETLVWNLPEFLSPSHPHLSPNSSENPLSPKPSCCPISPTQQTQRPGFPTNFTPMQTSESASTTCGDGSSVCWTSDIVPPDNTPATAKPPIGTVEMTSGNGSQAASISTRLRRGIFGRPGRWS